MRSFSSLPCARGRVRVGAHVVLLSFLMTSAHAAPAVIQAVTPLDGHNSRTAETSLGDLVTDAVRSAVHADIALVSASMLNDVSIPVGPVSDALLVSALPFPDDTVSILTVSGAQLRQALERSLGLYPRASIAFLQLSGITVRFDPSLPGGRRVQSIRVGRTDLDPARTYQVAMPISLARGSAGYFRIWNKDDVLKNSNVIISAAVIDFARTQGKLEYRPGDRITTKGQ